MTDTSNQSDSDAAGPASGVGIERSAVQDADLPMLVVDRTSQNAAPVRRHSALRWGLRVLALLAIIAASVLYGGVSGLYRQPKPLQAVMAYLGLEPGAGTSTPIALPVDRNSGVKSDAGSAGKTTKVARVVALGRLLPAGEVVTIAPPSGAGDARIASLAVAEGDRVERGQIIAILDNEAKLKAAVDQARATVLVREADLERSRAVTRASLDEAKAALERSEAVALNARQDFQRTSSLYGQKIASRAAFDQKRAVFDQSQRSVEEARATLSRFLSTGIDAQSDVVVATRNLEAARFDLKRAQRDLEQAYVSAPLTGTILEIHSRAGERPDTEGILDIGDIDHMTAKVEVYQTSIAAVSVGDAVEIRADALPGLLSGVVSRIGLQVKRQTAINADPAANTDARIVEVTVRLDPLSSQIASQYTNLQVQASIAVRPGS